MYEHVVLEKYRVDSAGTHLQIVIPDKDVSYYITDKKARSGELRIDDGRHISSEQRKKIYATIRCVAINTGLGFHLWLKEEFNKMSAQIPNRDQEKATDAQLKTIQTLQDAHPNLNFDKWIAMYNFTWDTLTREAAGNILKAVKERYGDD